MKSKKIPHLLDNPTLILRSRNVGRGNNNNTRIVVFGTIKAQDGKPILSVLDLRPIEENLVLDDMQKVTSAYTKDNNPVSFVRNSEVVYADKKKTAKLLRTIGLYHDSSSANLAIYDNPNFIISTAFYPPLL